MSETSRLLSENEHIIIELRVFSADCHFFIFLALPLPPKP